MNVTINLINIYAHGLQSSWSWKVNVCIERELSDKPMNICWAPNKCKKNVNKRCLRLIIHVNKKWHKRYYHHYKKNNTIINHILA